MNLITIRREKQHITKSKEYRIAFINKKRFVNRQQESEYEADFYRDQPSTSLYLRITSQQSISELIRGGMRNLKLLSYLTWVDDLDLDLQMRNEGLTEYFIELTKQVVKNIEQYQDYDQILCQIFTGINNLSEVSPISKNYIECVLIVVNSVECSDQLIEVVISIIKSNPICTLCKGFLFNQLLRGPFIVKEALIALQRYIKQNRLEKFEQHEIQYIFNCIEQRNKNLNELCYAVLKKMQKSDSESFKDYFRAHRINDLLTNLLKESKSIHLAKFLRDAYPIVKIDYRVLFDIFDAMLCIKQLNVYLSLLNKYVDDGLVHQQQIMNHLKTKSLSQSCELSAECLDMIEIYMIHNE